MNKWSFRNGLGIEETIIVIDPRRIGMIDPRKITAMIDPRRSIDMIDQKEMHMVVYLKT